MEWEKIKLDNKCIVNLNKIIIYLTSFSCETFHKKFLTLIHIKHTNHVQKSLSEFFAAFRVNRFGYRENIEIPGIESVLKKNRTTTSDCVRPKQLYMCKEIDSIGG